MDGEETQNFSQSKAISGPRFEPWTCQIRNRKTIRKTVMFRTDLLEPVIDTRVTGTMWTGQQIALPLAAASGNAQTLEMFCPPRYYSLTWATLRTWRLRQFSESPVNFYQKTRRNIPEFSAFHSYRRENPKSNCALSQNSMLPCTSGMSFRWKWLYTSVSNLCLIVFWAYMTFG
jgi:hypothetical protein